MTCVYMDLQVADKKEARTSIKYFKMVSESQENERANYYAMIALQCTFCGPDSLLVWGESQSLRQLS